MGGALEPALSLYRSGRWRDSTTAAGPGRVAIGTWSGGRFMHFGEPVDEERLAALLRPGDGIDDRAHRRRLRRGRGRRAARAGARRASSGDSYCLSAPSATTSSTASATALAASPASPTPRCAGPATTPTTCGRRPRRSLERVGARSLRRAAAPQPRPHRLHLRGRLGRDGGARATPGLTGGDRGRARARERLHPRPDRLLRALRRPDRLGDGDPQPARALAGRALPRRRPPPATCA